MAAEPDFSRKWFNAWNVGSTWNRIEKYRYLENVHKIKLAGTQIGDAQM